MRALHLGVEANLSTLLYIFQPCTAEQSKCTQLHPLSVLVIDLIASNVQIFANISSEKKALSLKCLLRSDCKRQKPIFIFKSNLICATKLVVQIGETIRCCVDLILRGITAVPEFTGCLCINLICSVGFQSIIRSDRAVKD